MLYLVHDVDNPDSDSNTSDDDDHDGADDEDEDDDDVDEDDDEEDDDDDEVCSFYKMEGGVAVDISLKRSRICRCKMLSNLLMILNYWEKIQSQYPCIQHH